MAKRVGKSARVGAKLRLADAARVSVHFRIRADCARADARSEIGA